jgi:serine beta-lactamase-like protein LACTB
MRYAFFAWLMLFVAAGCTDRDADRANYKYSVASWQGTHVYSKRYEGAIRKSRQLIMEAGKGGGLPGAQIAVIADGELCWSENFGFSDLEKGTPVRTSTLFRIASTSKILTAAAVAKLMEQGKLHLDTPVVRYLPSLPHHYSSITMRHLVSHQSGIRHYFGADRSEKTEHYHDVNDALNIFVNAPLLFEPGQQAEYSSYAWVVVSAVIQKVSGKPFLQYMKDEVWNPLQMKNTFGEIPPERRGDVTKFYQKSSPDGSWQEAPYQDLSFNWAGAGTSSTASDLAIYGNALLNGSFLKRETIDNMFMPHVTLLGDTTGFGIGFMSYVISTGEKIVGHSGFMPTARSYLLLFPESGVAVAYVCNSAMTNFADENIVAIAHHFIREKNDAGYFNFDRTLHEPWKGFWQVELQGDDEEFHSAYLQFYEDGNELKGALMRDHSAPVMLEVSALRKDTLECLAPFQSFTTTILLTMRDGVISGHSILQKPHTFGLRKQLMYDDDIRNMLLPKEFKNGKKLQVF